MNTLESEKVRDLVTRLFAEANASDARLRESLGRMTPEERSQLMANPKADYRAFYGRVKEDYLAVSEATAKLLYMLGRATQARSIVEFGTSFGISTIHLAAALRDNGGGQLVGSELEPGKVTQAWKNLEAAGLADLVDIREGDALETLAHDLPASIDLVLLDGHKALYPGVLDLLRPRLRKGCCIVADNADMSPDYMARVRSGKDGLASMAFSDDVELTVVV